MAAQDTLLSPAAINELTDKFEALKQATKLLELEKKEYITEIQKLKYSNNELNENLKDLELLTNDRQQQTTLLTSHLSSHAVDLDAGNLLNESLKRRLKQKTKTVQALTRENTLILERNKQLEVQLEKMNQKYTKYGVDKNTQIEQYQTKIIELQNMIDILQLRTQRSYFKPMRSTSTDVYDDEEKSVPIQSTNAIGRLSGVHRERTLELNLGRMFSSGSDIKTPRASITHKIPRTPRTPRTPHHYNQTSEVAIPTAVAWRNKHYKGNSTIRFNYAMLPIQQSESDTQYTVDKPEDDNDTVYSSFELNLDEDGDSLRSSLTRTNSIRSEASYSANTNATAIVAHDSKKELEEQKQVMDILMHRQQIEYEMKLKDVNDTNEVLKKQLLEMNVMFKECERNNDELKGKYISEKRKMIEEWIKEKDDLIELYTDQEKDIWRRYDDELKKMHNTIDSFKENELKLKQKIKQMKIYKKDKEVSENPPPPAGGCYTNWFKF